MCIDDNLSWELIQSEPGPVLPLFQPRFDLMRNPRNDRRLKAIVLETANWVNVVAVTPEQKLLVVRQYRFGVGRTTTEIPAGLMNEGETSEQAARRELQEETGCTTDRWTYLGWVEANPAFLNNICHLWLARDVVRTHSLALDESEDVEVTELTLEEVQHEIRSGRMRNALTLLALSQVFDQRGSLAE